MSEPEKAAGAVTDEAGTSKEPEDPGRECPFCLMMRKGGCEAPFQAFMDCGEKADKSSKDMGDCLPLYEALHACMDKNKDVFDALLGEMKAEADARDAARGESGAEGGGGGSGGSGEGGGGVSDEGGGVSAPAAAAAGLEAAAAQHHHQKQQ
ncbi:MAG: hypothetical protein J3K34DRAFT_516416 [Monoraphidium minutum]|nr:MAG: hypothetical protein J3K34DRAFT_516416 [Monoraphidium minutum]